MSTLRTLLRVLYSLAAALQVVAAIAVATRAWWIAAVFLGAAALLGRGALRGCSRNLLAGSILAVAAPLLVGLTGIEEFQLVHHAVRITVLTGMLVAWHQTKRSASATSPAPSA